VLFNILLYDVRLLAGDDVYRASVEIRKERVQICNTLYTVFVSGAFRVSKL
jgi:hypothetical protein